MTQYLRALGGAVLLAAAGVTVHAKADASVDATQLDNAAACFRNNGGPEGCPTVLGWCSMRESNATRLACRRDVHAGWRAVLDREWRRLEGILEDRPLTDRADPDVRVWDRITVEQAAWETYRDARCGWDAPAPTAIITVPEESRLRCLEAMTRSRAQQLWDLSLYLKTTPLD